MDAKEAEINTLIGELRAIANIHRMHNADPTDWAGVITRGANALRSLLAENAKLKETIKQYKSNEREKYASAAKTLGVVAPCDRATLLNEKGGGEPRSQPPKILTQESF